MYLHMLGSDENGGIISAFPCLFLSVNLSYLPHWFSFVVSSNKGIEQVLIMISFRPT